METDKVDPHLLNCPFCGAPAGVKVQEEIFQIVGCMTSKNETMLCPSPLMTVYKKDGEWDYQWWNRREN